MAFLALVLLATWVCIQALLLALERCFHVKYLTVGWVTVSARTAVFNRTFSMYGRQYQGVLRQWFAMGVIVAAMLGTSACLLLLQELWKAAAWMRQMVAAPEAREAALPSGHGSTGLAMAVPGVTVPWSHALYLWLAAAISISFHEAGHALAAASEGVGMHYSAAFLLFLLPGAVVALDSDTLALLTPSRTLRVVCAGVWHNAVLCMACWLIALLLPWLLWPAYSSGQGAVLRGVAKDRPLEGHLAPLDMVTGINQCQVASAADLVACLARPTRPTPRGEGGRMSVVRPAQQPLTEDALLRLMVQGGGQAGYCVPLEVLREAPTCVPDALANSCGDNQLCFTEVSEGGGVATGRHLSSGDGEERVGRCLDARAAVGHAACAARGAACPSTARCVEPLLPQGDHLFKLCYQPGPNHRARMQAAAGKVKHSPGRSLSLLPSSAEGLSVEGRPSGGEATGDRTQDLGMGRPGASPNLAHRNLMSASDDGPTVKERGEADGNVLCGDYVVFLGSQGALLRALDVTDYLPKFFFAPLWLPHLLELLLAYTFSVSAAVALLNMAPVYYLDGEAALEALFKWGRAPELPHGGPPRVRASASRRRVDALRRWVLRLGTAVFVTVLASHALRLLALDAPLALALRRLKGAIAFLFRGRN